MSCCVPRSFYHPVAVLQSATKGRVGTPTLIYNFARGHLRGRQGFFRVWVPPTLPCPGQGPVAKGWRFFFCLTVLWQLSEWIENNWPFVWKSSECLGAYVWPQTLLTVPKSSKGTPLWTWPSKRQRKNFEIFNLDVDIDIDSGFVEDTDITDNWNSER